ncbi:hypothetical protein ACMFMF_003969 [Clarireedia jacksonii]
MVEIQIIESARITIHDFLHNQLPRHNFLHLNLFQLLSPQSRKLSTRNKATKLEYKSQVTYGDRPARHGEEVQMSTIMRVTNMHVLHGGMDLDLGLGLDLYIGKKSEVANHIAPKKAAVIAGEINIKHILPLHPRKMSIVGNL